jgi:aldehyde dehydrogenase (NAD+)
MTSVASQVPRDAAASGASPAAEVARLRATFRSGRTRDISWRLTQLAGIERLLAECEGEIVTALRDDLGRPAHYAWLGDIAGTAAEAAYARKHLRHWARRRTRLPLAMQPGRAFYQ